MVTVKYDSGRLREAMPEAARVGEQKLQAKTAELEARLAATEREQEGLHTGVLAVESLQSLKLG